MKIHFFFKFTTCDTNNIIYVLLNVKKLLGTTVTVVQHCLFRSLCNNVTYKILIWITHCIYARSNVLDINYVYSNEQMNILSLRNGCFKLFGFFGLTLFYIFTVN